LITYKQAGVDIDAGDALVERIKRLSPTVGGFVGLLPLPKKFKRPMLVGCTDGAGTKLKIAFLTGRHDTVGIDLVAMNVNDLICCGALPLFFLDYFACGKLDVGVAEQVIKGIAEGCRQSGAVLLGGETAEMPGFYKRGEYDLAGFAVGAVERSRVIDGKKVRAGDVLVGLPSSGIHSNGYSLVRKLFSRQELSRRWTEFLAPTKIYVKAIRPFLEAHECPIKAIAHITGGGFIENIPRVFPTSLQARIHRGSWPISDLFMEIRARSKLLEEGMFRTFNMGIGMVLIVSQQDVASVQKRLGRSYVIGEMEYGSRGVRFV
jgi:phosphoribosylformylglycinamidine cyclo-ligase